MRLNPYGEIVRTEWEKLPERWPHIHLDVFQVMPNHFHAIILLQYVGIDFEKDDHKRQWKEKPTVGQIIGAYCSISSTACLKFTKENYPDFYLGKVWQRGFWDHVIRHERAYRFISDYIMSNPANWEKDRFYSR